MDKPLQQLFSQLSDPTPPPSLHGKIMRRAALWHFRWHLWLGLGFITLSLVASTWHLVVSLIDDEVPELIQLALTNFELSASYFKDFATIIVEAMSPIPLALFLTNLAVVAYLATHLSRLLSPYTERVEVDRHN